MIISSKKIFLSHSCLDCGVCDDIVKQLDLAGIPKDLIFYSSNDETGVQGSDFLDEIFTALDESRFNIILLSKNYMRSKACLNEAGIIWFKYKRRGIPVYLVAVKRFYTRQLSGLMNSGNCQFHRLSEPHTIRSLILQIRQAIRE